MVPTTSSPHSSESQQLSGYSLSQEPRRDQPNGSHISEKPNKKKSDDTSIAFNIGKDEPPSSHGGSPRNQKEPLIQTGKDISDFVVSIRDDGDESLTFRSIFLGTIFAGLGASLAQVRIF